MRESITWQTTHGDTVEVWRPGRVHGLDETTEVWRYRVRAANGEIVEVGESYTRRHDAERAAERHHPRVEVEDDPEEFCPACLAGMESSEHHEKCAGASLKGGA